MTNALLQLSQVQLESIALPKQAKDIAGQDFGKLRAIAPAPSPDGIVTRHLYWSAICSCGNLIVTSGHSLRQGKTLSCGCDNPRKTTHGLSGDPAYGCWENMRQRCNNPRNTNYKHYGARGITVDPAWDDFAAFLADMGPRPSLKHSIERKDNNGNYNATNCVWATMKQQSQNRRPRQYATAA